MQAIRLKLQAGIPGLFGLLFVLMVTGCATRPSEVIPAGVIAASDEGGPDLAVLQKDFRLAAGDEIEIRFYYVPDLNNAMRVRPDGMINLSLIPSIRAAGKTPEELEAELRELYRDKVDNPELSVIVRDLSQRYAFVDGEVLLPKAVPLGYVGMSVSGALAQAGGVRRTASMETVVLLRRAENGIEAHVLDLSGNNRLVAGMTEMAPGDILYVPMSKIGRVGDFIDLYVDGLMPNFIRFNGTYNLGSLDSTSRSVVISGGD